MIQERGLGPQDHLFTGPQGGLLTPSNWRNRIWHPAVLKAGIEPPATPHALRHTAISRWIAAGATAGPGSAINGANDRSRQVPETGCSNANA